MPVLNSELRKTLQELAARWVDAVADREAKARASEDAASALRVATNRKADAEKLIAERAAEALRSTQRIVVLTDNAPSGAILIEQGRVSMLRESEIVGLDVLKRTPVEVVGEEEEEPDAPDADGTDPDVAEAVATGGAPVTDVAPEGDE